MNKFTLSILIIGFLTFTNSYAQDGNVDPGDQVKIELKDGSVIYGIIKSQEEGIINIQSETFGNIAVQLSEISRMELVKKEHSDRDQQGMFIDYHNSTHYLFAPSAYTLKKGQSYYENIGVFWNSYTTGVTDNFSVTMGGEIASLLFGSNFPVLFISPKFSMPFQNETGAFAVTTSVFTTPEEDFNTYGFITGSLTMGSRNNNFTIGSGIGFSSTSGFENEFVPFNLSTMLRIGPKLSFLSENWIVFDDGFNDSVGFVSAGLRIHFKTPGNALNVFLWRVTEDMGDVIAIPFVSATIAIK